MNTTWHQVAWTSVGIKTHQHLRLVNSTNSWAAEAAANLTEGELPLLVTCDRQTAGRGRGERQWWQGEGGLAFSVVLTLPQNRRHTEPASGAQVNHPLGLPLLAAITLQQTAAHFLPNERCQIKWPNDLMVNDRKSAGILIEPIPHRPESWVVGVGVNVNNQVDQQLSEFVRQDSPTPDGYAAYCWSETGRVFELSGVLYEFLVRFLPRCTQGEFFDELARDLYVAADWLTGKLVVVTAAAAWRRDHAGQLQITTELSGPAKLQTFTGVYAGIDPHGYLQVDSDAAGRLVFPSVNHLRPLPV